MALINVQGQHTLSEPRRKEQIVLFRMVSHRKTQTIDSFVALSQHANPDPAWDDARIWPAWWFQKVVPHVESIQRRSRCGAGLDARIFFPGPVVELTRDAFDFWCENRGEEFSRVYFLFAVRDPEQLI
jgi:hypothetical protein